MTLSTHAIIGVAVAELFPRNPLLGIIAAFVSHFAADAIPHWDYALRSYKRNKEDPLKNDIALNKDFVFDILKIGADGLLGLILPLLFFVPGTPNEALFILLAAIAGMLPDGLQFVYFKIRREPLTSLQRFHIWIHSKNRSLRGKPLIGIPVQIATLMLLLGLVSLVGICVHAG